MKLYLVGGYDSYKNKPFYGVYKSEITAKDIKSGLTDAHIREYKGNTQLDIMNKILESLNLEK